MTHINRITQTHQALRAAGRPIVKLFAGNPVEEGFAFPPDVLEATFSRFARKARYDPDPRGLIGGRRGIGDFYKSRGWPGADPDRIVMTCGTSESYHYLFTLLRREEGDRILAPCPAYPLLDHIAQLSGVSLVHYPLQETRGWAVDVPALESLVDARTRAIVLISPHNPTGHVHTPGEIGALARLAREHNLALIVDEVFAEFYFGPDAYPRTAQLALAPLVFTLDGLSKMCALPWAKLGWIVVSGTDAAAQAAALDRLETIADTFLSSSSWVQTAVPDLLAGGAGFMARYRDEVGRRRDLAVKILGGCRAVSCMPPAGGFYVTARIPGCPLDEEDLVIRLLEETGLFAHPGYFFDIEGDPHLILSFLPAPGVLEPSLARLCGWLEANASGGRPR